MNEATLGRAGRGKGTLDAVNDALPDGVSLHPTKGWRRRGDHAIDIDMRTAMYRQDIRAWFASWLPKAVRA